MPTPIKLYTDKTRLTGVAALRGIDGTAMDEQIARQSGKMDDYFRPVFKLPLTRISGGVTDCCTALVVFNLLTDRGWNPKDSGGDQAILMRYQEALDWLKAVAAGQITPDVDDSSGAPEGSQVSIGAAVISNPSRGWSTSGQGPRGGQGAFVGGRDT